MAVISSSMTSCSLLYVMPVANMPQLTTRSLPEAIEQNWLRAFSQAFCSSWAWLSELGAVVCEGTL